MEIEVFVDSGNVDISIIDHFEAKVSYFFPESYKRLLSKHNELYPENCDFRFFNETEGVWECRDVTFLGYGPTITNASRIDRFQDHDVYGHDGIVVIGCSANGDYICFDYRSDPQTANPPVVVMFHDYYNEDKKMLVCSVANTFEEFINSLYKAEEDI